MTNRTFTDAVAEDILEGRLDAFSDWHPAAGGTEVPFLTRHGVKLHYLFNPTTREHAYLDVDSDILLEDTEADRIIWGTA